MAVVRGDPVLDGLQRRSDPVLLLLEQVERDGSGVVSLEQLVLLALELGSSYRQASEFGGSCGRDAPVGALEQRDHVVKRHR